MRILSFFSFIFYSIKIRLKTSVFFLFVCCGFFFVFFAVVELYYAQRIFPRVYFGGIPLSGKRLDEATYLIETILSQRLTAELVYVLDYGQSISLGKVSTFASYDVSSTVANAFSVGRTGGLLDKILSRFYLLRYGSHIAPVYAYNRDAFERTFHDAFYRYEQSAVNSFFLYQSGQLTLSKSISVCNNK